MNESFWAIPATARTHELQPHARHGRVCAIETEIADLGKFICVEKENSRFLVISEKRDAVDTGRIEATGKIAQLAVVAEYRDRTENRHSQVLHRIGGNLRLQTGGLNARSLTPWICRKLALLVRKSLYGSRHVAVLASLEM